MIIDSVTDDKIKSWLEMPKRTRTANDARKVEKPGHDQWNLIVESENGEVLFEIYRRQNQRFPNDFSCGISTVLTSGDTLTLRRYNGPSHVHHNNPLENEKFRECCHIHEATERYIIGGYKPEKYAIPSEEFKNLKEAFRLLLKQCNVTFIGEEPNLFNQ
jgi:hypothetical protein